MHGYSHPPTASQYDTYYAQHDVDGPAEFSTTVVHALSDLAGVDVTETRSMLYDSIDPDALNHLFRPKLDGTPRPPGHVVFSAWNYRVTAYSDGRIAIQVPSQQPVAGPGASP